jgi:glycosyltransferase involved in cell wall biosynthesis
VKVLLLCRYGPRGASSRVRMYQFLPALRAAGIDVTPAPLVPDALLGARYATGRYPAAALAGRYVSRVRDLAGSGAFDLLWVEYELFPWLPALVERLAMRLAPPFVLELDDAIFHRYDRHRSGAIRALLGRKIDRLMAAAAAVVVGNPYLAARAADAGAREVIEIPSVVDTAVYTPGDRPHEGPPVIGWMGSPTTAAYIHLIEDALGGLVREARAQVTLVGVEPGRIRWGFPCTERPWVLQTEVADLQGFDVGIMPLPDTPWERGKCGYKLVQYMACGKPVVASPVGVNPTLVRHGVDGFLAEGTSAWRDALAALLDDPARRAAMGAAGRVRVVERWSSQVVVSAILQLLRRAAGAPADEGAARPGPAAGLSAP